MESALGALVSQHVTDNDRRRRTAWRFLAVAVVGLGAGVPLSIGFFTESGGSTGVFGSGFLPGGLAAIGLVGLVIGLPLVAAAARTRNECFDVHQHGLVHRVGDTERTIEWERISSVRPRGAELGRGGPHTLGIDFSCTVRLADGDRLKFGSFTADVTALAERIEAGARDGMLPAPAGHS